MAHKLPCIDVPSATQFVHLPCSFYRFLIMWHIFDHSGSYVRSRRCILAGRSLTWVLCRVIMSTRLYRDLFQYITKYALQAENASYPLSTVLLSDHDPFARRRSSVWPHRQNVQVSVCKTVEVDVGLSRIDAEQPGLRDDYKQTATVRSKAELDLITAEIQMKKGLVDLM